MHLINNLCLFILIPILSIEIKLMLSNKRLHLISVFQINLKLIL